MLQQRELQRRSDLLRVSRYRRSPDGRLRRRSLSVIPALRAPGRMHRGTTVHGHDLSWQPRNLRQVRGSHVQHPSALLPQHGQVLPGGLGILLPVSGTSISAFQLFGQVCMDALNNGASVDVSYLCELP